MKELNKVKYRYVTCVLHDEEYDALIAYCEQNDKTVSEAMRTLVKNNLSKPKLTVSKVN